MEKRLIVLYLAIKTLMGNKWKHFENRIDIRKEIQKFVYFLQEKYGVSLEYTYNLYVYGPYSPSLTSDTYELFRDKKKTREIEKNYKLSPNSESRIRNFKKLFYENDRPNIGKMELATTLHFLYTKTFSDLDKPKRLEECSKYTQEIKSHFTSQDIDESFRFLKRIRLIA